jgi:hypothetical protein
MISHICRADERTAKHRVVLVTAVTNFRRDGKEEHDGKRRAGKPDKKLTIMIYVW